LEEERWWRALSSSFFIPPPFSSRTDRPSPRPAVASTTAATTMNPAMAAASSALRLRGVIDDSSKPLDPESRIQTTVLILKPNSRKLDLPDRREFGGPYSKSGGNHCGDICLQTCTQKHRVEGYEGLHHFILVTADRTGSDGIFQLLLLFKQKSQGRGGGGLLEQRMLLEGFEPELSHPYLRY